MTRKRITYFKKYEKRTALKAKFKIYGNSINRVRDFKYLGRVLEEKDDDSVAASRQLQRARSKWNRIAGVLKTQGVGSKIICSSLFAIALRQQLSHRPFLQGPCPSI
jgi:hypothetical protein